MITTMCGLVAFFNHEMRVILYFLSQTIAKKSIFACYIFTVLKKKQNPLVTISKVWKKRSDFESNGGYISSTLAYRRVMARMELLNPSDRGHGVKAISDMNNYGQKIYYLFQWIVGGHRDFKSCFYHLINCCVRGLLFNKLTLSSSFWTLAGCFNSAVK